ncbi:MAG: InlB B-repeat-containing protein, partial [Clostridia bacterium]|nr:InlB B-repeat-containing protein [Clostridia bacterium]
MNYLFKNRRVIAFILALVCFLSFDFALLAEDISSEIYESALEPGPSVETDSPEEEEPEEKIISEVISSEIQEEPEASEEPVVSEEPTASGEPSEEPGIEEKTEEEVKEEVETVKEEVKEVFLEDDDSDDGKKNGETEPGETSEVISSEIKEEDTEKKPEEDPSKAGEGEQEPESGTKAGDGPTFTVTFNVDGSEYATVDVPQATAIGNLLPAAPTKEGYRFDRWDPEVKADTVIEDNMTVNAVFVKTWTVTFYNRDAEVLKTVVVDAEEAIGSEMPATIAREDYDAYWAIGKIVEGAQGSEISVTGARITSSYVPTDNMTIVPDYVQIVYTVTFYTDENKTEVVATKTVNSDTSYCLNDIPTVPTKNGYAGKWVYSGGDFGNDIKVNEIADNNRKLSVWAEYDKNVFTVKYIVEGKAYQTDSYNKGEHLTLPYEPAVEGKQFVGWYIGETEIEGGETVTSDLTITAQFTDMYSVTFIVEHDDQPEERLSQYFRDSGEAIGTMPQDPFIAGKVFEKWINRDTGEEVTATTVVNENIVAVAVFREVIVYNITAEYYYLNDRGEEVIFNTDLLQVEEHELPYTITAPSSTKTDPREVSGAPVYYPETPTATISKNDFTDNALTVRFKYVKYTAIYDFVYKLKDLTGDGYTEIDRTSNVQGVLNSYVTPTVKQYPYAVLELAESAVITLEEGQELVVYYTRKNFQLTYNTNGGSYVAGTTVPYGTSVNLPSTNPTREGYNFAGWYSDEALTQAVTGTVIINADTTLYAKWTGKTVNYTIVYLFEQFNDNGTESSFVYDNSETGTGTVGTTIHANDNGIPDKTKTGWEKDTAQNNNSSVVIAADGSSVLFVYYKLREYTFRFNAGTYNYNYTNYYVEATLTGKNVTGTGLLSYTMTVKLGQDISSTWPGNVTGRYYRNRWRNLYFDGWLNQQESTRYVTKRTIVTPEMLPNSGTTITYIAQWTNSETTYTVNYWLQNADDDNYTLSQEYSQTYTSSSGNLGAKEIAGYTYDHGNSGASGTTTYNFYYNRDTFKIDYYYGSTKLDTIDNIKFDATINKSPYTWTPTTTQCNVDNDYTFVGWYSDSDLTTLYTFNKMPAANVVLYAKWQAPTYIVSFVDTDETTLKDSQTVEKYKKATNPGTPVKEGYTFDGWYTSAEGSVLYDWNTQITEDTTVYAHWIRSTIRYVVHYVDEDRNPVADDKVVENPNYVVGQTVTEYAIAVAGYRPTENSKDITLAVEGNEITFFYSEKTETTSYTVRYILDPEEYPGSIAVAEQKTVNNVPGDTASVIELAKAVDYSLLSEYTNLAGLEFFPDAVEKTLVLTANAETNVLTFYYSSYKSAHVTVHFVDMARNSIANDDVQVLKVGKTFTLSRTPIAGWELNKAVVGGSYNGTVAGTDYKITDDIATSGLEFTIFYQKKLTITVNTQTKQYDGTPLTLPSALVDQITVDGLENGDTLSGIEFTYDNIDVHSPEGRLNAGVATVTPKNAVITGTHAGTPNYYSIKYLSGALEVTKINVTIRIEPDRWTGAVYTGELYKTGFTNPNKGIEDYVMISHEGYKTAYLDDIWNSVKSKATYDPSAVGLHYYGLAEKNVGDYTYNIDFTLADLPSNDNYSVSIYVRPGRLQILPKELTVTTGSAEKAYDGTPLTKEEASLSGLVVNDSSVTVSATGTITNVGSTSNTYRISWGGVNPNNYTIKEELGTLTVTEGTLIITVKGKEEKYNGTEQTGNILPYTITGTKNTIETDEYTITGLAENDVLSIVYTPSSGKNYGLYTNGVFGTITVTKNGEDITDYYQIIKAEGSLSIKKRTVTLTSESGEKPYDGTPLTKPDVTVGGDGFVAGEVTDIKATGSV